MVGKVTKPRVITEEPAWMKILRDDSYLNTRDMRNLFNITNESTGISTCIENGTIPKPSATLKTTHKNSRYGRTARSHYVGTFGSQNSLQWRVSELRKFFKGVD
jgi:hypothetical protein